MSAAVYQSTEIAIATYQEAANRLEVASWDAARAGKAKESDRLARMAHHARFAARRNRKGRRRDCWEQTP